MIESFNEKELEAKIDRYVNGKLSASEVDELWAELIQDDYHLDYLKSVANLKAVVERKRSEKKENQQKRYWYYAAAAVVALLIAVLGVINLSTNGDGISVEPVSTVELDYYRSGNGTIDSNNESKIIRSAISLANTGEVDKAISLLDTELSKAQNPEWIAKLSLNLGSLYYNQANYSKAIELYQQVITNKDHIDKLMLEKAYWYTGNAYFHMDDLAEARTYIEKAYDINGAYRRVSKSYLNALSE